MTTPPGERCVRTAAWKACEREGKRVGGGEGNRGVGPETFQRVVKPLPASAAPVPAYLEDASVVPLKRVRGKGRRARR
jgi:hypothetical protein